jgi:hypothetical protein
MPSDSEAREALREAIACELFDDTADDEHGQLCPIWTRRRDKKAPIWTDCDCRVLRRVRRQADIALGAPALREYLRHE